MEFRTRLVIYYQFSYLVIETTSCLNIRAKKYKVVIELHVELDLYVFGDQLKQAQVINNLLDYVIKFSTVNIPVVWAS